MQRAPASPIGPPDSLRLSTVAAEIPINIHACTKHLGGGDVVAGRGGGGKGGRGDPLR